MRAPGFRGREPGAAINCLQILGLIASEGPGVSAAEIGERLRMPRATAYRLLKILTQEEYVVRAPDLTGYLLGVKTLQIAATALSTHMRIGQPATTMPVTEDTGTNPGSGVGRA